MFTNVVATGAYAPGANSSAVDFGMLGALQGGQQVNLLTDTNLVADGSLGTNLIGGFTACGWLNARSLSEGWGGNRIVYALTDNNGQGFDLVQLGDGSLRIGVNSWPDGGGGGPISSVGKITADPAAGAANWVFFAVTFDPALANGNLKYYFGRTTNLASLDTQFNYTGAVGYGARVFGCPTSDIQVGDRVEAVGFPELVGRVVTLHESVLRKVDGGHLPAPVEMMLEGILDGRLNCWLVRLEGIVLDQKTRQGRQLLELQNGQRVFEAVLAEGAGQLKPLPIGSRVQVTGVTQLQLASNNSDTAMRREYPLVATMDILMRTPADLVLLERPPWWTWRHTASVGVLLLVVLAGALGWIRALRRRVAQRTSELHVAMSQLQKETELSATLAERERLAAEIHDTLEQGLSGIMMQLDGIDSRMANDNSGARENLEMARRMVRFSRAEVRHSLWNLESQLLKDGDLGAAIREIVRQMVAGCSTAVTVDVSATIFPLPAAVEHHLLRCSQEALSNALKHSRAATIRLTLNYTAQQVELKVEDDGCGFDPGQVMTGAGTHLGLRNLRSRARKMKGRLDIASQPGKGTTIRLTVPLNERPEKTSPSIQ